MVAPELKTGDVDFKKFAGDEFVVFLSSLVDDDREEKRREEEDDDEEEDNDGPGNINKFDAFTNEVSRDVSLEGITEVDRKDFIKSTGDMGIVELELLVIEGVGTVEGLSLLE